MITLTNIGALEMGGFAAVLADGALEAAADLYAGPVPVPPTIHGFQPGCVSDGMLEAASGIASGPCATGIMLSCHRVDR